MRVYTGGVIAQADQTPRPLARFVDIFDLAQGVGVADETPTYGKPNVSDSRVGRDQTASGGFDNKQ